MNELSPEASRPSRSGFDFRGGVRKGLLFLSVGYLLLPGMNSGWEVPGMVGVLVLAVLIILDPAPQQKVYGLLFSRQQLIDKENKVGYQSEPGSI